MKWFSTTSIRFYIFVHNRMDRVVRVWFSIWSRKNIEIHQHFLPRIDWCHDGSEAIQTPLPSVWEAQNEVRQRKEITILYLKGFQADFGNSWFSSQNRWLDQSSLVLVHEAVHVTPSLPLMSKIRSVTSRGQTREVGYSILKDSGFWIFFGAPTSQSSFSEIVGGIWLISLDSTQLGSELYHKYRFVGVSINYQRVRASIRKSINS